LNEKLLQNESLASEFTYPKTASELVRQPRLLWINAICINQEDNAKRNSQVRIKREIHVKAFLKVIWLGLEQEGK
jgi:hypothetical protein